MTCILPHPQLTTHNSQLTRSVSLQDDEDLRSCASFALGRVCVGSKKTLPLILNALNADDKQFVHLLRALRECVSAHNVKEIVFPRDEAENVLTVLAKFINSDNEAVCHSVSEGFANLLGCGEKGGERQPPTSTSTSTSTYHPLLN